MVAILHAVGDVGPDREDPRQCFALARETLRTADLGFCQLEVNLTTRGARMPQARHTGRAVPASAAAMRDAGFDVVSFAGNHCMDWGPDGLFDTMENLRAAGLHVVGVGADINAARAPVIREVNGTRIAFVAYSSILPEGYWATDARAGCAPMRAILIYEQIEPDQPGTPPRVHTWRIGATSRHAAETSRPRRLALTSSSPPCTGASTSCPEFSRTIKKRSRTLRSMRAPI